MFKVAENLAKSQNHRGLKLYVERENQVARQVYLRRGFKFPDCEILESDMVFAFNSKEYVPEQYERNFQTYLRLFNNAKSRISNYKDSEVSLKLVSEMSELELEKVIALLKERNYVSLLNPQENSVSGEELEKGIREYLVQERHIGTKFLIFEGSRFIGLLNSFEEYSDWRGGQMAWVYDFKLDNELLVSGGQFETDLAKSYLVNVNIELLKNRKQAGFRNVRWQVYKGDGSLSSSQEQDVVRSQLLDSGLVVYNDDIMILEF
jgi:hypothetical protein